VASSSAWVSGNGWPGGDRELPGHEVDAVDELGDRVLDLQAGVHLEEVELAVVADEELAGAGADVVAPPGGGDRGRAHARAQLGVDRGARRLLDDLLVAALDRAVALAEVDDSCRGVGEDLDLDVARPEDRASRGRRCRRRRRRRPRAWRLEGGSRTRRLVLTRRMPLPPPPAAALIITGKPIPRPPPPRVARSGKPLPSGPLSPGTTGAPAADTVFRASVLLPMRIAWAGGPMKVMPAAAQASAKSSFSDRKP
jgi:hypothetical protein